MKYRQRHNVQLTLNGRIRESETFSHGRKEDEKEIETNAETLTAVGNEFDAPVNLLTYKQSKLRGRSLN